jgi:uncharacterized coiled-coil DUF342 family protein
MKNVESKKYQSIVKKFKNNKTLSNEEFISEKQGKFPNIWA